MLKVPKLFCLLFLFLTSCNGAYAAMYPEPIRATITSSPSLTPSLTPFTVTPHPTPTQLVCDVTTGYQAGALNMRTGPGTEYAIIRVLREGENLQVIDRGAWLKVSNAGGLGYVNAKYCKMTNLENKK